MEKTLTIDGRQVRFKSSGGVLRRYRNQFNAEFMTDLAALGSVTKENYKNFSIASMEQIVWALAKTADDSVPDPQTWLDSFEEFDIYTVYADLGELIEATLQPLIKKAKNAKAAASRS